MYPVSFVRRTKITQDCVKGVKGIWLVFEFCRSLNRWL